MALSLSTFGGVGAHLLTRVLGRSVMTLQSIVLGSLVLAIVFHFVLLDHLVIPLILNCL